MTDKTMAEVAENTVDKIVGGVEHVVAAFERIAPHAWDTLVTQQYIHASTHLFVWLIGLAITLACLKYLGPMVERESECLVPLITVLVVVGILTVACAIFGLPNWIGRYINPEYYAAQELMETLKGLSGAGNE